MPPAGSSPRRRGGVAWRERLAGKGRSGAAGRRRRASVRESEERWPSGVWARPRKRPAGPKPKALDSDGVGYLQIPSLGVGARRNRLNQQPTELAGAPRNPSSRHRAAAPTASALQRRRPMDRFHDRQYVWLRSRVHGTYLHANSDGKTVSLHRRRAALRAAWAVHIHQGDEPYLLLYNAANGRYLAATATRAPPGHIGFRAEQRDYDQPQLQAIMWRAAETGFRDDVLLRNAGGRYLRANGKYTGKYLRLKNVTVDGINNVSTMMYWTVQPIPLRDPNSPLGLAPPTLGRRPRELPDMLGRERGVRRLIRFVRASAEGAFAEDGWSEFHFTGTSVYQLRNELYSRIGPHRHPHPDILPFDLAMCVRAGRYGRLTPLVVNLPHGCNGETLQIVLFLSRTPAYGRLRYPDVHAE